MFKLKRIGFNKIITIFICWVWSEDDILEVGHSISLFTDKIEQVSCDDLN